MIEQEILDKFPLTTPRDGQINTIKWILNQFDQKKFVILEGPCGVGKSVLAMTVARFFNSAYWATPSKHLQDQLCGDFGESGANGQFIVDLKGRNAYTCTHILDPKLHNAKTIKRWQETGPHSCSEGHCRHNGKSMYAACATTCPYLIQANKAAASPICLMNFSSFLYQTSFTKRFYKRDLLILDEGHNIESQLMGFVSLSVSDIDFDGLMLPELNTAERYAEWLLDNEIEDKLKSKLNAARIAEDIRKADDLESQITRMARFTKEMTSDGHAPWVTERTKLRNQIHNRVVFKPVFIDSYAHKLLFDWADKVIIMSATILDVNVVSRSLNIDKSNMAAMRLSSKFPVDKRPIYFKPAAKIVGGKSKMAVWAKPLVRSVNAIANKYPAYRGIIHTHNFYITEMIINDCDPTVKQRLLYQKEFRDKTEMMKYHAASQNTILIAPAMHEGIDLAGDLCYDSETDILTEYGWTPFPNLIDGIKVAQFDASTQKIQLVLPTKLHSTIGDKWVEFDTNTNNLMVTANHRMLWDTGKQLIEQPANDLPPNRHSKFVCAGELDNEPSLSLTDGQIKLAVALQADGHWTRDTYEVRFVFRRKRKQIRLREILRQEQIEWRESHNRRDDVIILVNKKDLQPTLLLGKWHQNKLWQIESLLQLSQSQRDLLLDELQYWDGSRKVTKYTRVLQYTSALPQNIDTIQAIAAVSRRRSWSSGPVVYYCDTDRAIFVPSEHNYSIKNYSIKTPAYCVEVPSGWVVVRRKGKAVISGNSRFQIVCKVPFPNQFDDKQLAARMEIDPQFYEWLTALKLVQCVGRSVRSETDWADTYIVDQSFEWWYRKNGRLIPQWFKEAVVF